MAKTKKVVRTRRRERKNVVAGQAHVQSTFNNTIISITDVDGNVISWGSAGAQGFKGSRKSTPYAAQVTAEATAKKALEHGMRSIEVFVRGPGAGREAAIRSLQATGLEVSAITDVTPIPHNGCRPPKREACVVANYSGPVCRFCRREGAKPTSRATVLYAEMRDRASRFAPRSARPGAGKTSDYGAAARRQAEGGDAPTGCWRSSSATVSSWPSARVWRLNNCSPPRVAPSTTLVHGSGWALRKQASAIGLAIATSR